jgi:hypothetical protein
MRYNTIQYTAVFLVRCNHEAEIGNHDALTKHKASYSTLRIQPSRASLAIPAVGPPGRNDESHRKETNRDNQPLDQLALADGTSSRCTRSRASLDEWISSFLKVLVFNYNEQPGGRVI